MPRTAYCTGCNRIFGKMHWMIDHRRTERCGGRFLPDDKWLRISNLHAFSPIHPNGIKLSEAIEGEPVFAPMKFDPPRRPRHKARTPGTVRFSHLKGGSGYRGDSLWEGRTETSYGGRTAA